MPLDIKWWKSCNKRIYTIVEYIIRRGSAVQVFTILLTAIIAFRIDIATLYFAVISLVHINDYIRLLLGSSIEQMTPLYSVHFLTLKNNRLFYLRFKDNEDLQLLYISQLTNYSNIPVRLEIHFVIFSILLKLCSVVSYLLGE